MLSRRKFLQTLLGGAVGAVIAPHIPKSYFFLGKPAGRGISLAEANEVANRVFIPGVIDNFFKSSPLLHYLKAHDHWAAPGPVQFSQLPSDPVVELATFEEVGMYAPR